MDRLRTLRSLEILLLTIAGIGFFGVPSANSLPLPYDGASVSISGAQYTFNASNEFTTAVNGSPIGSWASTQGSNTVNATFFNAAGNRVSYFSGATLEVLAVDFSGGLAAGAGGGFTIKDSGGNELLNGVFGDRSSLYSSATGADFVSSMIVNFSNSGLTGVDFYAPGLFAATLGDVGTLALGQPFTTRGSATATIQSSAASVPEPSTLLLLGSVMFLVSFFGGLNQHIGKTFWNHKKVDRP